jgi:hypothetical protein
MHGKEKHLVDLSSTDRRSHPRTEAHLLAVFRRSNANGNKALPLIGYTRDISSCGAYFYTQSDVKEGDSISVTIHFTADWTEAGSPPKLVGEGTVARVENTRRAFPPIDINGTAVRFWRDLTVSI